MSKYHVGIIPDGNRRWAHKQAREVDPSYRDTENGVNSVLTWLEEQNPEFMRQLERFDELSTDSDVDSLLVAFGHWKSAMQMSRVWEWASDTEVDEISMWGLSRDNVEKRNEVEVSFLNHAYRELLSKLNERGSPIHEHNVKVVFCGDKSMLEEGLVSEIESIERDTESYDGGRYNVALAYDGLWDTARATNAAVREQILPKLSDYGPDSIPKEDVLDLVDDSLTSNDDEVISRILSRLEIPPIDILLGYGPDRAHLSHFADLQVGYATVCFPLHRSNLTRDVLTRLQAGEVEEKVLPKKHWPESDKADFDYAIRKHEFRSKTKGA